MDQLPQVSKTYVDPHRYPDGIAFQDGQYFPVSEAKISVLDWGFLHSDATYDTVHVWDGSFFRLDLHLDRFFQSLTKLRMSIPYNREELTEILSNCVALSGHRNAYVEMLCTRGGSPSFSRDPREAINRFMAFSIPYGSVANKEQMEKGLHVAISDIERISPKSVNPSIKNYHWLDLISGLYDAYDRGAETALLLDADGDIAEGPGFNVFMVKNGQLTTPEFGVLSGITRRTVFDLCERLNLVVNTGKIAPQSLISADEVFITSTAGGIMPVTKLNDIAIGNGEPGSVTGRIKSLYWEMHTEEDWSLAVNYHDET